MRLRIVALLLLILLPTVAMADPWGAWDILDDPIIKFVFYCILSFPIVNLLIFFIILVTSGRYRTEMRFFRVIYNCVLALVLLYFGVTGCLNADFTAKEIAATIFSITIAILLPTFLAVLVDISSSQVREYIRVKTRKAAEIFKRSAK